MDSWILRTRPEKSWKERLKDGQVNSNNQKHNQGPGRGRNHPWEAQMGAIPISSRLGQACRVTCSKICYVCVVCSEKNGIREAERRICCPLYSSRTNKIIEYEKKKMKKIKVLLVVRAAHKMKTRLMITLIF